MRSLSLPYSGALWKRHYGGGQGRANISVIYTSEIKRESAGKAVRDVIEGRGRAPGSPAGTPAVRRLGRSFHVTRGETQDPSELIESPAVNVTARCAACA